MTTSEKLAAVGRMKSARQKAVSDAIKLSADELLEIYAKSEEVTDDPESWSIAGLASCLEGNGYTTPAGHRIMSAIHADAECARLQSEYDRLNIIWRAEDEIAELKKALWFSRHTPSAAQLAEVAAMGYEIAGLEDGLRLGAMNLADDGDLNAVLSALLGMAAEHGADAAFGVFAAAPLQEGLHRTARAAVQAGEWPKALTCFASWNVQRSADGGKPTFSHRRFCCVGMLAG